MRVRYIAINSMPKQMFFLINSSCAEKAQEEITMKYLMMVGEPSDKIETLITVSPNGDTIPYLKWNKDISSVIRPIVKSSNKWEYLHKKSISSLEFVFKESLKPFRIPFETTKGETLYETGKRIGWSLAKMYEDKESFYGNKLHSKAIKLVTILHTMLDTIEKSGDYKSNNIFTKNLLSPSIGYPAIDLSDEEEKSMVWSRLILAPMERNL